MAIVAHPDDIEFCMAGTLLLLRARGWQIHYMTLSSGNCGSTVTNSARTRSIRRRESMAAAKILGAHYHPSLCDDLEIFYDLKTLRRLAAIIRDAAPAIVLTHSPHDYMEDHTNTCRLTVSAAFARAMPNFKTTPARKPVGQDVALYHAMPHGLRDPLRKRVIPELFVGTDSVHAVKREALAAHRSQKEWLDASQGMDSYLRVMEEMSAELGTLSRKFKFAEGWRRHLHLGFSAEDLDPLQEELKKFIVVNQKYQTALDAPE